MKTYNKEVSFVDRENNKYVIECEITTRNGYYEFTAHGHCGSSCGQCLDTIVPLNDAQKKLVEIWESHHMKEVDEEFLNNLTEVLDDIESLEEDRKGEPLEGSDEKLIEVVEESTDFCGRDAELCVAFIRMFNLSQNDLDMVEIDETECKIQGTEYLAGDDEEMDKKWDESLESYIDDCLELPDNMKMYFDREKWKNDARVDGRGHSLNRYDGGEEYNTVNGTEYFAYMQ